MKTAEVNEIMESIRASYGSLSDPDFSFLRFDERVNPLNELLNQLGRHIQITDDTDPNTDVCFSFVIQSGDAERFLQISLVGPYACVRVLENHGRYLSAHDKLDAIDKRIFEYLEYKDLKLVEPTTLATPVHELVLFNTDPSLVSVYHALFSDSGVEALK